MRDSYRRVSRHRRRSDFLSPVYHRRRPGLVGRFYLPRSGIGSNDPLPAEQRKAINFPTGFDLFYMGFVLMVCFFFGEFQLCEALLSILNSVSRIAYDSGLNFRQVTSTISGKYIKACLPTRFE